MRSAKACSPHRCGHGGSQRGHQPLAQLGDPARSETKINCSPEVDGRPNHDTDPVDVGGHWPRAGKAMLRVSSQVTLVAAGPPEILPGSSGPVMQRPCFGEGGAGLAF